MKTYIEQMWDKQTAVALEIANLERFKNGAFLTDEQFDLIEEEIRINQMLQQVIKKRIDYDTKYLQTVRGDQ